MSSKNEVDSGIKKRTRITKKGNLIFCFDQNIVSDSDNRRSTFGPTCFIIFSQFNLSVPLAQLSFYAIRFNKQTIIIY